MFSEKKYGLPESLIKAVQEATKTHTVPKTEKEKKLAALAEPKDKITHADVMAGRGVTKEEADIDEGKYVPDDVHIDPNEKFAKEKAASHNAAVEKAKQMAKQRMNKEETDTPGNSYEHQCAIHVKHAKLGEGKTLFSQHAEPAEDGTIEWYDVMFEHGIEKKVPTTDLEILVSESHMNHKKKGK